MMKVWFERSDEFGPEVFQDVEKEPVAGLCAGMSGVVEDLEQIAFDLVEVILAAEPTEELQWPFWGSRSHRLKDIFGIIL